MAGSHQLPSDRSEVPPPAPVTGLPGRMGGAESDVHFLDRLHVLYKYRQAIVAIIVLVLVAGIVQTYTTTPAYKSTAIVRVDPVATQFTSTSAAQQAAMGAVDPEAFMQTELTVLTSRDLKRKVVRKLRLDKNPEFMAPVSPQGLEGALGVLRGRVMAPIQSWLRPTRPEIKAPPSSAPATAADPDQVETTAETQAIESLSGNVTVSLTQISHIFTIDVSSSAPALAAEIANTLAEEYRAQNIQLRRARLTDQLTLISDTLNDLNAKIESERRNLIDTTSQANVLDPDTVMRNVSTAQGDYNAKTIMVHEADVKAKEMAALDPEKNLDAALVHPDILRVPTIAQLKAQIQTLRAHRTQLIKNNQLGPEHPMVKADDDGITLATQNLKDEVKQQIQSYQAAYQTALRQEQTAAKVLESEQNLQRENSRNGIPYQALRQRISGEEKIRDDMQAQQKETEILARGVDNNVTITDHAQPASTPYKPDTSRNILISLAIGIVLSLVLAFGLDYLDDTIKTPEDVTRKLHIPFLGLVPAVRGDRVPVLSGPVPHDFGEAYRALRTSLVFTSGGESTRIMSVTSAQPLEGKTTTACNLAMVLAFGGSRVLLIDADMRRPGVHKTLKMNNTVGLSHLLVGQARVREAIQRTSDPNFCVMTAGRTPPNPSELLASERMKQLASNLKQGPFDWVVIDTPPVLAVTDAVILTPLVDGVTFVIGAEMTRRRLAERAVTTLMASRPKVIGGVLNRVNFDRNKYYYSRYYGYQYKSYYGTDSAAVATPRA